MTDAMPKLDPSLLEKLTNLDLSQEQDTKKTNLIFNLKQTNDLFNKKFPHGVQDLLLPFSAGNLEKSVILSKTCLVPLSDKTKETHEIALQTNHTYGPGDSLGILCENSPSEVSTLITRLGLGVVADSVYTLNVCPGVKPRLVPKHVLLTCSVRYALLYTLDIHSLPKKALLVYLAESCTDQKEADILRFLASKEGSTDLNDQIYSRSLNLLELLTLFPSSQPSFSGLLQFLPRLTPRYYSVSRFSSTNHNSPENTATENNETAPGSVRFVYNHIPNIRQTKDMVPIPGVCSTMIRKLSTGKEVWIYPRKNAMFKPRSDSLVLIGAGTGVAPYLGFLDYLSSDRSGSYSMLITGNRYRELDSVYRNEFEEHEKSGVLSTYHCAYSRDESSTCKYVQDVLQSKSSQIVQLLESGTVFYVCGDAKGLSVRVMETLKEALVEINGISLEEAAKVMAEKRKSGLYCEDIWA